MAYTAETGETDPTPAGVTDETAATLYQLIDSLTIGGLDGAAAPRFAAETIRTLRR